ncbi:hypothetical protein BJ165DRAFT_1115077 [Panaeolus papilionaceus]|nr:hypothetical protein BJ165DRAFT_1115077 [Panaeolus papilionaceus]
MPMSPDPTDTSRRSTRDHDESKGHSVGVENNDSSTNPPDRAQKSEMEEMRLELELMKEQMRVFMDQTKLNTKNPVAETSGRTLSDSKGRGPRKPAEAAVVGHLSQEATSTEPVMTGGSPGGGFGSGFVRYLIPSSSPQTPRNREMEKLKVDLKKRTADLENCEKEVKRLQREMRSHVISINTLQKLTGVNDSLHQELLSAKKELEDIKTRADTQTPGDSETEKLKAELRTHVTSINTLEAANNSMNCELINVKKELEEIKALADSRGKELLDTQKFLTKADSISISELKEKVVALNDEIFQAAVSLGESITHEPHGMTEVDASRMYGEVLQLIGEPITRMLVEEGRKPNADPNPLLVQVVLQIFMTQLCASKIEQWVPNDPKISKFFEAVYNNVQYAEEPAVSGRWRALTQTHTRPITQGWKEGLISSLMNIIKIAAWKMPDKEHRMSFEAKLVSIFKAVEDLRIAIGEKITSADIRVSLVPPQSLFEASWMDDELTDARAKVSSTEPIQCVVGTTRFGLKKLINGRWGLSGEPLYESILSPKVALESTLKEALQSVDTYICGKD